VLDIVDARFNRPFQAVPTICMGRPDRSGLRDFLCFYFRCTVQLTGGVLTSLTLAPFGGAGPGSTTLTGAGGTPVTGILTFSGPVQTGGVNVAITVDNPAAQIGSSSILVSGGQSSSTFSIDTSTVQAQTIVHITATLGSVVETATLTLTPNPLAGTWSGQWAWMGTGSNGCTFNDAGAFSMTLTQSGNTYSSANVSAAGVQTRDAGSNCDVVSTDTVTGGTATITSSGTSLNLSFSLSGSSFTGTATLNNNTLTATFQRTLNGTGPGSFTLTRQ
jgi:hypothetical protein